MKLFITMFSPTLPLFFQATVQQWIVKDQDDDDQLIKQTEHVKEKDSKKKKVVNPKGKAKQKHTYVEATFKLSNTPDKHLYSFKNLEFEIKDNNKVGHWLQWDKYKLSYDDLIRQLADAVINGKFSERLELTDLIEWKLSNDIHPNLTDRLNVECSKWGEGNVTFKIHPAPGTTPLEVILMVYYMLLNNNEFSSLGSDFFSVSMKGHIILDDVSRYLSIGPVFIWRKKDISLHMFLNHYFPPLNKLVSNKSYEYLSTITVLYVEARPLNP